MRFLIYSLELYNNYSYYDMILATAVIHFSNKATPIYLKFPIGLEADLKRSWIGVGLELQTYRYYTSSPANFTLNPRTVAKII